MVKEDINKSNNIKKYTIIITCMLIQAIPFGIAQNIQPLFVPYVIKTFGFSLAGFSLIFTFGAIASASCSPFLGKLYGKVNIKILFLTGIILSSFGFILFGFAKRLSYFYVLSAILQIGTVIYSSLGVPYVINNWFPDKGRGKALGISFAGGGIGNIFLQQIASRLLEMNGEHYAYIVFGIVSLVIGIPLVVFFIRLPKESEVDLQKNITENSSINSDSSNINSSNINSSRENNSSNINSNDDRNISNLSNNRNSSDISNNSNNSNNSNDVKVVSKESSSKSVRKNIFFWTFCIGYSIIGIAISALSTQYATYFNGELGMNSGLVGILGSTFALFSLIGNVSGGVLFDKMGTFKTMLLAMIFISIATVSLIVAKNIHYIAFLFSIFYGLNVYSFISAPGFMATDIFGRKDSSEILGTINLLFALGFAFGTTIFGMIVDRFGFMIGWFSILGCVIVGYLLLLSSIKIIKKSNI